MKVLVTDPIHEEGLKKLKEFADVNIATDLSHEELIEKVSEYEAMVVRSATKVRKDVLDAGEELELVVRAGVGLDSIDVEYAEEIGVQVENTPEASTTAVSELTLGLMLAWARKISKADKAMKNGKWAKSEISGTELKDKTVGIIGTGRIGCSVAEKAHAFGMNLLAYDVEESPRCKELGGKYVDLQGLLRKSDYITIHVPLNSETRHLIGDEELEMMKNDAVIVNVARGQVVEEDALIRALEENRIGGACLDVYDSDPVEDGRLLELDNVILTPHIGASTKEAQKGVGVLAAEKIREILG